MRRVWPADALGLACDTRRHFGWACPKTDARSHRRPCLPLPVRYWAQPSGLLRLTGESSGYFMAESPIARSLGRQWPPIESGVSPITAGMAGRIAYRVVRAYWA